MGSYIINFAVYTMAMCGLIFFALFVYKKFATGDFSLKNSQFLGIEDAMSIGPRKTLYVIRAGKERFLVASNADNTTLISKLEIKESYEIPNFEREMNSISKSEFTKQNYEKMPVNIELQHVNNSKPAPVPAKQTQIVSAGIDELPNITAFPQNNKKSNNVLKSMVNKIKVKE